MTTPPATLTQIALDTITERLDVRTLSPQAVTALATSMRMLGYLPQFPVLVTQLTPETYRLLDGAHRVAAAYAVSL